MQNWEKAFSTREDEPSRPFGRPTPIDDNLLLSRRNELVFLLEQYWGFIGWQLKNAVTLSAIRAALKPIAEVNPPEMQSFIASQVQKTTRKELGHAESRLQRLLSEYRSLADDHTPASEQRETARIAVASAKDRANKQALKTRLREQERKVKSLEARKTLTMSEYARLSKETRAREAYFCQSELLEFIRSDRYAHDPVRFANAMAGLPQIGWRQSATRCRRFPDPVPGVNYEAFSILESVLRDSPADRRQAIRVLRKKLMPVKDTSGPSSELRSNWLYLQRAIEETSFAEEPSGALPYVVFAKYEQLRRRRTPADLALEGKHALAGTAR